MNMNKSQFYVKSIQAIYICIYIDLFYVKAGKKIFVEEMMGGVLKRHKKQFLGEIGARRVAGQISLKIWISSMTK